LLGHRQVGKTTLVYAERYFADHEDRLVVLDEVHRAPELFQTLRGVIDAGRRRGRSAGRFLLLGSAAIDVLKQSGESLAGRISYLELAPFDALEIPGHTEDTLWVRGGFPSAFLAHATAAGAGPAAGPPANVGKRLVKSPKVYIRDAGLAHALLGLATKGDVLGHPVAGHTWETMVVETLIGAAPDGRGASSSTREPSVFHSVTASRPSA
jgi:predicted AAA+ superfamily ATPase